MKLLIYLTVLLFISYVLNGMNHGVVGPTLVPMETILHTDTQGMAMALIGDPMGGLLGCLVSALYFDKYNTETQLFTSFLLVGIFTSLAPWMPNIYLFSLAMAVRKLSIHFFANGSKPYILQGWRHSKYKNFIFQVVEFAWLLGVSAIPIIVIQFIKSAQEEEQDNEFINLNSHDNNNTSSAESARYPYMLIGISSIIVALLINIPRKFSKLFSQQNEQFTTLDNNKVDMKDSSSYPSDGSLQHGRKESAMKILTVLYAMFSIWLASSINTYISVFVVKELGWTVEQGSLMIALFRNAQTIGRLIGLPVSVYLSPATILGINLTFGCLASTVLYIATSSSEFHQLMWLAMILFGCAMCNTYPTLMLWGSQYVRFSTAYSSMFGASAALGILFSNALAGFCLNHFSLMSIIYVIIFPTIVKPILFISISYLLHC